MTGMARAYGTIPWLLNFIPEGQGRSLSPDPIRQHVGSSRYQQNGGTRSQRLVEVTKRILVFAESDQVASSTSPRESEHHSRELNVVVLFAC